MSSRLSPRAKRDVLLSPADKVVSALVSIASSVDRDRFTRSITKVGGQVISWSDTTNVVTLHVPASALNAVADLDGVVYVETGGRYSP